MAKLWLITFYPEMARPLTVPAARAGFDEVGDVTGLLPAETLAQAIRHAAGWSLPSDERKPRVFRGHLGGQRGHADHPPIPTSDPRP